MRPIEWNADKPHRCPNCHSVTDRNILSRWAVVTCCRCGARFTKYLKVARFLPKIGVVCPEHRKTRRWK